jgi:hypothetical protein
MGAVWRAFTQADEDEMAKAQPRRQKTPEKAVASAMFISINERGYP